MINIFLYSPNDVGISGAMFETIDESLIASLKEKKCEIADDGSITIFYETKDQFQKDAKLIIDTEAATLLGCYPKNPLFLPSVEKEVEEEAEEDKCYPESWQKAALWRNEEDLWGIFEEAIKDSPKQDCYSLQDTVRELSNFVFDECAEKDSPKDHMSAAAFCAVRNGVFSALAHTLGVDAWMLEEALDDAYYSNKRDDKPMGFDGLKKEIDRIAAMPGD